VEVEEVESELLDTELHSVDVGVVNFGVGVSSLVVGTLFDSVTSYRKNDYWTNQTKPKRLLPSIY